MWPRIKARRWYLAINAGCAPHWLWETLNFDDKKMLWPAIEKGKKNAKNKRVIEGQRHKQRKEHQHSAQTAKQAQWQTAKRSTTTCTRVCDKQQGKARKHAHKHTRHGVCMIVIMLCYHGGSCSCWRQRCGEEQPAVAVCVGRV